MAADKAANQIINSVVLGARNRHTEKRKFEISGLFDQGIKGSARIHRTSVIITRLSLPLDIRATATHKAGCDFVCAPYSYLSIAELGLLELRSKSGYVKRPLAGFEKRKGTFSSLVRIVKIWVL